MIDVRVWYGHDGIDAPVCVGVARTDLRVLHFAESVAFVLILPMSPFQLAGPDVDPFSVIKLPVQKLVHRDARGVRFELCLRLETRKLLGVLRYQPWFSELVPIEPAPELVRWVPRR